MLFEYKTLNEVRTPLITWGNPFDNDGSDVILVVSGNPGVPDFYIEFGTELHQTTGKPVCVIGHAGHEIPEKWSNIIHRKNHLYTLEGQLEHKLDLINNHIDKRSKLHLIGHSIGAWMVVELLDREEVLKRTCSVNLLFPTLQKMAETKNGKVILFLRKIHFFLIAVLIIAFLLPEFILAFFIGLYIKFNSLPSHYEVRIQKFINAPVIKMVLFLAYDEMDKVRELNTDTLDKIKHMTNVIYSCRDGWAPTNYMDSLKPFQPPLCMMEVDINHAFVLKSGAKVAKIVAPFIQ